MRRSDIEPAELGRVAGLGSADVLSALQSVSEGRVFDLDVGRFPGMPQWEGHPTFMLVTYRSPRGVALQGDVALLDPAVNPVGYEFASELMISGMHVGTHIDALCHAICGDGWHGGYQPDAHLGDFGALRSDASTIPPIIVAGTLLDMAGHRGVEHLASGTGISDTDLAEVELAQGTPIPPRSAVFVRTGLMSTWPDRARFDAASGAGPDLAGARWLREARDAVLVGSDTPAFEQIPSAVPTHPHPVHDYMLRQHGVHLLENLWLEDLARAQVYRFTLICLSLKITGATGSMVRPIAIV